MNREPRGLLLHSLPIIIESENTETAQNPTTLVLNHSRLCSIEINHVFSFVLWGLWEEEGFRRNTKRYHTPDQPSFV